jgi:response regulator NasT
MGNLRVLLGDPDGRSRSRIKKILVANGYSVVAEATDCMAALRHARMVGPEVAVLSEELAGMNVLQVVTVMLDDRICPSILISINSSPEFIGAAKKSGVLGLVPRPIQEYTLIATLELAYETYRRLDEKEHEIEDLKSKLENRKLVEKAKGIIMQKLKFTESEAYRYIQKRSMDQKVTMKQIAEAIILTHEFK